MAAAGKATIALAAVLFVLVLNMGYSQAQSNCPSDVQMLDMMEKPCEYYVQNKIVPAKGTDCCNALLSVKATYHPSADCMCQAMAAAQPLGMQTWYGNEMIASCDSEASDPHC